MTTKWDPEVLSNEWLVVTFAPGFEFIAAFDTKHDAQKAIDDHLGLESMSGEPMEDKPLGEAKLGDYVAIIKAEYLVMV